jgi:hypothetical protein
MMFEIIRVTYRVPFYPNVVEAHLLFSRSAGGILKYFLLLFHQKLRSNFLASLPSQVLESTILTAWMDLFLQREDSVGQPMGHHADSYQDPLFQVVNFVGQSCY